MVALRDQAVSDDLVGAGGRGPSWRLRGGCAVHDRGPGGRVVEDAALSADWVRGPLRDLAADRARLQAMAAAAASVGVRDGDERLADLVERAVRDGRRGPEHSPEGGR